MTGLDFPLTLYILILFVFSAWTIKQGKYQSEMYFSSPNNKVKYMPMDYESIPKCPEPVEASSGGGFNMWMFLASATIATNIAASIVSNVNSNNNNNNNNNNDDNSNQNNFNSHMNMNSNMNVNMVMGRRRRHHQGIASNATWNLTVGSFPENNYFARKILSLLICEGARSLKRDYTGIELGLARMLR